MLTGEEWSALWLSCQVGACAVLGSLPPAVALGYGLARWRASGPWHWQAGRWLVQVLVDLPLVLPPVVTGYLLLLLFVPDGPVGGLFEKWFGVRILFTWRAAAAASAVVSFPLLVRSIRLAFHAVDPRLEFAARSLGASRWDAFLTVSLPLARRGVLAGSVLAFARSLGEFGATMMVLGSIQGQRTIPVEIYSLVNQPGGLDRCWRLVVLAIVLASAALAASEWLERRQSLRESA